MSLESPDPEEGSSLAPTGRTRIGRKPERGSYDRETLNSILDAGIVCHLGFSVEDRSFVIPTTYARRGGSVLFHGAPAARPFVTRPPGGCRRPSRAWSQAVPVAESTIATSFSFQV